MFFPKQKKPRVFVRLSKVVETPKARAETLLSCKITCKANDKKSIHPKGFDLIILVLDPTREHGIPPWNFSYKFGKLTAKLFKSSVSDLHMKYRTRFVFESHGKQH